MDVDVYSRRIKNRLGEVLQENNLAPDFSAYRNLLVHRPPLWYPKKGGTSTMQMVCTYEAAFRHIGEARVSGRIIPGNEGGACREVT